MLTLVAEEQELNSRGLGSTTFRRQDLKRGTEPDSCFYIQNVERIRGKKEIDLTVDPPPDLVIEVEITSPAVPKLPVYARLGVPEIWLYDGRAPRILRLAGDQYENSDRSGVLPCLTESVLSEFLEQSKTLTTLAWRRDGSHLGEGAKSVTARIVRELIREDETRKAQERLAALLLEGLASEESELTRQDFEDIRNEALAQVTVGKKQG